MLLRRFAQLAAPLTALAVTIGYLAAGVGAPLAAPAPAAPSAPAATTSPPARSDAPTPEARPETPSPRDWAAVAPGATAADDVVAKAWLAAEGPAKGPLDGRRLVTLTFDDGPSLTYTPQVQRLLARYDVRATFFIIGKYLEGDGFSPQKARRVVGDLARAGHLIGNHTLDHEQLTALSTPRALAQIDRSAALIEATTGARPRYFRPPFGALDAPLAEHLADRGDALVLWNVEGKDWESSDDEAVFQEIVRRLDYARGGVVLLHDWKFSSVQVTRRLLAYLHANRWDPKTPKRAGYEVVDLPTYLAAVRESPQPFASRDALQAARVEHYRAAHPEAAPPPPRRPRLEKVRLRR